MTQTTPDTTDTELQNGCGHARVPLLIDGVPVWRKSDTQKQQSIENSFFQGASLSDCTDAIASCSKAFIEWSTTSPTHRRTLLLRLAHVLRNRQDEVRNIMKSEIHCNDEWATINIDTSVSLIEECAYLLTSRAMSGIIPHTESEGSYGLVFTRPLGVILGIAPWNAPLFLGLRAVVAPLAVGNTGSELSPCTHYFIAGLFEDAGFPRGVVNFILHRPQDAPEVVGCLIRDPAVRKVNFTGSTQVGRSIARQAGEALKPVLLELGGKNCSLILKDAELATAAEAVLAGATLNAGQICMSTDLVIVDESVVSDFRAEVAKKLADRSGSTYQLVGPKSAARVLALISDAEAKESPTRSSTGPHQKSDSQRIPATVLVDVNNSMDFFKTESFGPCLGIVTVSNEDEAVKIVNDSAYGLSASIWTREHYASLRLARRLQVGAVHINGSTVHDEPTLPHGGTKSSGFGRFGAEWGLQEFVETQTVILNA
ncbi:hypothetical protein ACHAPJ_012289 [Fusarium lateritium]